MLQSQARRSRGFLLDYAAFPSSVQLAQCLCWDGRGILSVAGLSHAVALRCCLRFGMTAARLCCRIHVHRVVAADGDIPCAAQACYVRSGKGAGCSSSDARRRRRQERSLAAKIAVRVALNIFYCSVLDDQRPTWLFDTFISAPYRPCFRPELVRVHGSAGCLRLDYAPRSRQSC